MPGYFSEIAYDGNVNQDFIEVAVPTGTDVSGWTVVTYKADGTLQETYDLGTSTQTFVGKDVFVIEKGTSGFTDLGANNGYALVDGSGTVQQFISFAQPVTAVEGPAAGQSAQQMGDLTSSGESMETTDGGATYQAQSAPNSGTIPCYAPGTLIDTPDGPRAVETLRPGNVVLTVDHGPQPIRWVRCGDHPLGEVEVEGKPVLIQAGTLGAGRPARDLIVSPQHRILVGGNGQLTQYFNTEAFVPAKALTRLPCIRHMNGKREITWIHFACDRHEVVTANGCQSESLLLGPMVVDGLTRAERRSLIDIYGTADVKGEALNGPAARVCKTVGEVRRELVKKLQEAKNRTAKHIRDWDIDLALDIEETGRLRDAARPNRNSAA